MSIIIEVSQLLHEKKLLLATAESCTGGWVAKKVTDLAGSSTIFDRGFVTYSNQAKREMLGVSYETLETYGAVSEQVAREMAIGAIKNSTATISVSISGIAGPGGGTDEKPVGMVCFGWAILRAKLSPMPKDATAIAGGEDSVQTNTAYFDGDRDSIRKQAVEYALKGIIDMINS